MRLISIVVFGLAVIASEVTEARCVFAPFHGDFTKDANTTGDCDSKGVIARRRAGENGRCHGGRR